MGVVDMNGLKTTIKATLDGANTTTGSPIDLSNGMATRVQKILTLNREKIPIQPSFYPCVTTFFKGKMIDPKTIAKDQLVAKRAATIDMTVVGIVWVDTMSTNFEYTDLADNECELLMENVEQVLRSDPTIGGRVTWSHPTAVTYHDFVTQEGAHLRAGVMNLQAKAYY